MRKPPKARKPGAPRRGSRPTPPESRELVEVLADLPEGVEEEAEVETERFTGSPGAPRPEPLSVEPDELGAHFLREAVQEPASEDVEDELDLRTEREVLTHGEQRMIERLPGGSGAETEGAEITELPDRSDVEAELSELAARAGREIRIPDRAKRIREQSRHVAKQRKLHPRRHPAR